MEGMPRANEHHRKLHRLAGSWVGEEMLSSSPGGPGGPALARFTMRIEIDGLFLFQDYEEVREERVVYRGHGILGWDEHAQSYAWYWVDSMGTMPTAPSRGHWEGNTLTLEHAPVGAQRGRYIYRLLDERTLMFTIENSRDGGHSYNTFLEGRYRRA